MVLQSRLLRRKGVSMWVAHCSARPPGARKPMVVAYWPCNFQNAVIDEDLTKLSSTLRISGCVTESIGESLQEGGWNFHGFPVKPGH